MNDHIFTLIVLLALVAVAALAAPRLRVPPPILLAVTGTLASFLPGVERIRIDPELILAGFLPPLLYSDAFHTSWLDFKRWMRPILMLAIGLVLATVLAVGLAAKWALPQMPWGVCFVLGAVLSPTDTVAVSAVLERLRVPRRVTAILGGESLVNDAAGLVAVQLGVSVVLTGVFDAGSVALSFARVAGLGVLVGAAVGIAFALANRKVRETPVLFALSLLSPYLAFLIAHGSGASGVLAVVTAGFIVAWRVHEVPPDGRVALYASWDLLVFLLNGFCFGYIGLEAPALLRQASGSGLFLAGLAASAAVMLTRIVWCFPGAYFPLLLSRSARAREGGYPPLRYVTLAAWCGVRGAVSLAAALALPAGFPGRDAVLACAMVVILVTLFAQGLTLGPLARVVGMREEETSATEERRAREAVLLAGIARLDAFCSGESCPIGVFQLRDRMSDELDSLRAADAAAQRQARHRLQVSREVRREIHLAQTHELLRQRDSGAINDEFYRRLLIELDRTHVHAEVVTN